MNIRTDLFKYALRAAVVVLTSLLCYASVATISA